MWVRHYASSAIATRAESAICCIRCEEFRQTITLSYEVMESSAECSYQAWREQSVNVGGYSLQADHYQRSKRNTAPGQRGMGWCGPAAAEFVGVAVRLSGLNCIH